MTAKNYIPCNKNAQDCVKNVLKYLSDITGRYVITGQHTQTMEQEELKHIEKLTGKQPALLGFELLAYSPNINYFDTDEPCITEVIDNYGTLLKAWEWADKKGLITFTWHWFSPLYGRSKSFYAENTEYDPDKALIEGTAENRAFISDMDVMAGILRPFCDKHIPILWRPFHESYGTWFWWGAKGNQTASRLYRMMYERFTKVHGLNNLIWVWNSYIPEAYPGDDCVDIISTDLYPGNHIHTSQAKECRKVVDITTEPKIVLLAETGPLPDVDAIHDEGVDWVGYMSWSKEFCLTEEYTEYEVLGKVYSSPYALTKDMLPVLY